MCFKPKSTVNVQWRELLYSLFIFSQETRLWRFQHSTDVRTRKSWKRKALMENFQFRVEHFQSNWQESLQSKLMNKTLINQTLHHNLCWKQRKRWWCIRTHKKATNNVVAISTTCYQKHQHDQFNVSKNAMLEQVMAEVPRNIVATLLILHLENSMICVGPNDVTFII